MKRLLLILCFGATMASAQTEILNNIEVDSTAQSDDFSDQGFVGKGWRIDPAGNAIFENLDIRGRIRAYEMLINQVRATNGSIFVSSTGKVRHVYPFPVENNWMLEMDTLTVHGFDSLDLIRAQRYTGRDVYASWLHVVQVFGRFIRVEVIEGGIPQEDYEYVRMGNQRDTTRMGTIYMTTDDVGSPRIYVKDSVRSRETFGDEATNKVVIGRLDGLKGKGFTILPKGYGLLTDNAYIKGSLVMGEGSYLRTRYIAGEDFDSTWIQEVTQNQFEQSLRINVQGQKLDLLTAIAMDSSGIDSLWAVTQADIHQESMLRENGDQTVAQDVKAYSDLNLSTMSQMMQDSLDAHHEALTQASIDIYSETNFRNKRIDSVLSAINIQTSAITRDSLRLLDANASISILSENVMSDTGRVARGLIQLQVKVIDSVGRRVDSTIMVIDTTWINVRKNIWRVDTVYKKLDTTYWRVDSARSDIKMLRDTINMSVRRGNVVTEINLDTSGVKISGKHIQIDGFTTFTNVMTPKQVIDSVKKVSDEVATTARQELMVMDGYAVQRENAIADAKMSKSVYLYHDKTTIDGAWLETGTVTADRVVAGISMESPIIRSYWSGGSMQLNDATIGWYANLGDSTNYWSFIQDRGNGMWFYNTTGDFVFAPNQMANGEGAVKIYGKITDAKWEGQKIDSSYVNVPVVKTGTSSKYYMLMNLFDSSTVMVHEVPITIDGKTFDVLTKF